MTPRKLEMSYWPSDNDSSSSSDSDAAPDRRLLAPSPPPVSSRPPPGIKLKLTPKGLGKIILKPPKPPSSSSYSLGNSNNIHYATAGPSHLPDTDAMLEDESLELPTLPLGPPPVTKTAKKNKGPKAKFGHGRKDKGRSRDGPKGPPRPQKLRPLKEVLQRLITTVAKYVDPSDFELAAYMLI